MKLAPLLLATALPAAAQQADAGTPDDLQKELEKAIQADSAPPAQGEKPPSAPPAATSGSSGNAPQTLLRGAQSLNPDLCVILDGVFGYERRAPQFLSGDDPDLGAQGTSHALGFMVQEVEEAFATTTSLPWSLQLKAGSFRSAFGRQNGQHLHLQDFTRRPLINAAFLGADGMRGPGAQVSWLAPLPFFLTLAAEAFSLRNDPADESKVQPLPVPSFGADASTRPTLAVEAKAFFPLSEAWSLTSGLSFASGRSEERRVGKECRS